MFLALPCFKDAKNQGYNAARIPCDKDIIEALFHFSIKALNH